MGNMLQMIMQLFSGMGGGAGGGAPNSPLGGGGTQNNMLQTLQQLFSSLSGASAGNAGALPVPGRMPAMATGQQSAGAVGTRDPSAWASGGPAVGQPPIGSPKTMGFGNLMNMLR